ncbi:hypothetical protein KKC32_02900 [Patescibacteria group bacterium]|nr:hypothetical protein [Patescibacteria group bacterium]
MAKEWELLSSEEIKKLSNEELDEYLDWLDEYTKGKNMRINELEDEIEGSKKVKLKRTAEEQSKQDEEEIEKIRKGIV